MSQGLAYSMDANKSPRERHGRLAEWIPGKLRSRANAAEFRARCRYETFFTQPGPNSGREQLQQKLDNIIDQKP